MSLESQIAALVSAANSLTNQVAGKMGEVDKAVKAAVEGVPQKIRDNMESEYWIHQTNGSDDNPGTLSAPLASLKEVANRAVASASINVYMLSDYTVPRGESSEFYGNQLMIRRSQHYEGTGRPLITANPHITSTGVLFAEVVKGYRNTLINIFEVDIHIPYEPGLEDGVVKEFAGILATNVVTDIPTPLSIRLCRCDITVERPDINPTRLITGSGMVMLSASWVTAPAEWINAGKAFVYPNAINDAVRARLIHDAPSLLPAT